MVNSQEENYIYNHFIDEVDDWAEYWREINKVVQNVRKISAAREKTGSATNKLLDLVKRP